MREQHGQRCDAGGRGTPCITEAEYDVGDLSGEASLARLARLAPGRIGATRGIGPGRPSVGRERRRD